jgi:hypothetical protein
MRRKNTVDQAPCPLPHDATLLLSIVMNATSLHATMHLARDHLSVLTTHGVKGLQQLTRLLSENM